MLLTTHQKHKAGGYTALMAAAICAALVAVPAQAGQTVSGSYDYAKVTHVAPIVKMVEQRTPKQNCWNETVKVAHQTHRTGTPTILGGLIGAAIGHGLGHGKSNRQIGAVAGSILGASVGHDIGRQAQAGTARGYSYHTERRCEVQHDVQYQERIVAYNVTYRYKGQDYSLRTQQHPGKRIKLRINFAPVLGDP